MSTVHLIEGPIGAGKSTYATAFSARLGAPSICLDRWFAMLFRPDRPPAADVDWYLERKARCVEQIWQTAVEVLQTGSAVVLELGLVRREDRQAFDDRVDGSGFQLSIHVVDAPVDVRRERVRRRNIERGETWSGGHHRRDVRTVDAMVAASGRYRIQHSSGRTTSTGAEMTESLESWLL
ncbi:MAG: AAA family ATPase [Gammaproteobacteria bacterium]|nr:AAA family ATPase [Gammaproteobacteria bacterium]